MFDEYQNTHPPKVVKLMGLGARNPSWQEGEMKPHQLAWVVVLAASVGFSSAGDNELPPGAVRMSLGSEVFGPGKPPFPPTAQVAILEGDPAKPGHFTA